MSEIERTGRPAVEGEAGRLRDRLADIETEQATLETELAAFHSDYMREVGVLMARARELEAKALRLVAERSGARSDRQAARQAEEEARRTTAEARAVPAPAGPPPTADLKRLFRDAAKRMHPDFARDEAGRAHAEAFMKRLNQEYRSGDGEAMLDLLRQWESSPYATALPTGGEQQARELAALRDAVARAERELQEIRESELAVLLERVMAAAATGGDLMADMRASAHRALADAQARLEALDGA